MVLKVLLSALSAAAPLAGGKRFWEDPAVPFPQYIFGVRTNSIAVSMHVILALTRHHPHKLHWLAKRQTFTQAEMKTRRSALACA